MKIVVLGTGYVGCVTAAVMAREGHHVTGVDTNAEKVETLNQGRSPVLEPGLSELMQRARSRGLLAATTDASEALATADVVFICVGTPSRPDGSVDAAALGSVAEQIAAVSSRRAEPPIVVLRSTALPEIIEAYLVRPLANAESPVPFAINPEFLREGSAIADFDRPPFTVIGTEDDRAAAVLEDLYAFLSAPFVRTEWRTASITKYAANAFHALKVAFANEIDTVSRSIGVDGASVMRLICLDRQLNISPAYLRPGMPFGGSCLPKDVRALAELGRRVGLGMPLISAIEPSNDRRVEESVRRIVRHGKRRIGFLGLSFKPGTDDLRESPAVRLVERLTSDGLALRVYDSRVLPDRMLGANREYLLRHLPGIQHQLCGELDEVLSWAEVVVIAQNDPEFGHVASRLREDQTLVDLAQTDQAGVAERGSVAEARSGRI